MPRGEAAYYDMLGADAFGNFRQLLQDVTLSPMMGQFLSMLQNDKGDANTDPDENYAREVMQLFTIGLYQLNDDGTQKLDSTGNPIPTYSNNDVMGLAKVFTGFSWNIPGNTSDTAWSNCCIYVGTGYGEDLLPMQAYPNHHSTEQKDFLGVTIPCVGLAGSKWRSQDRPRYALQSSESSAILLEAVDSASGDINPSPAYIGRVAAVFKDNGQGVRGDMKAVITAILLDPEARDSAADAGQSAVRQGTRSSDSLHQLGTGLHGAIAHRVVLPRQHRRSDLGPWSNDHALSYSLQLVCSRLCRRPKRASGKPDSSPPRCR